MHPRWLFPLLALAFVLAALIRRWRSGRWRGAALTWLWLGTLFGMVGLWLNRP